MKRQETVTAQPKDVDLGYPATASPYFNGSSDQIDIPYAIDLNPSSFTVEMWVQFQGGKGYRAILTSVNGSALMGRRGYVFCINPAQQWQFWLGSGQKGIPWIILTGWKAKEGVWTHLAGTYDSLSETMILYVNGQTVGQWTGIQYQPNDRNPMHVGAGATEQAGASSCFFHGSISQVRIWERSLSSAEIQIAAERSPDDRSKETATPPPDQPEPQSTKSRGRKQSPTPSTSGKQTTQKQRATASAQSQPTKSRGRKQSPTPSTAEKQTTQKQRATASAQSQPTESRGRKQSPTPPPSTEQTETTQKQGATASTQSQPTESSQPKQSPTPPPQTEQTASSQSKQSESTQPKESLIQPVLVFNGLDDYVEVPYSASLNPSQFTLFCWVKVQSGQGTWRSAITSRDDYPTKGYILYAGENNRWQFWIGTGKQDWTGVHGSEIVLNTWTSLAATYDGSKMKLYVNGELVGEREGDYVANSTHPLRIGAGATEKKPMYFFPGQISEVRVWNRVCTQKEIQTDMHRRLKGYESGLVYYWMLNEEPGLLGYWPLNESIDSAVNDPTHNLNHGKIYGATWQQVEMPIV